MQRWQLSRKAEQRPTESPSRGSLTRDRRDADAAPPPRATRPHSHRGDGGQPPAEAPAQDPRRGLPTRTGGTKTGKRPRTAGFRPTCPRAPGWAHERSMGSSRAEGPGELHQDADPLDEAAAAGPETTAPERQLLGAEKQALSSGGGHFFYIGGTNGTSLVSAYCKNRGWQRTLDSRREDYALKWCEVKCRDSYGSFREGKQLLYQIPNNSLLTTKIGLLSALREDARATAQMRAQARSEKDAAPALEAPAWDSPGRLGTHRILQMEEFFPETYRLDVRDEREAFFGLFDETQMWICKPTASNQGKGIFLLRSQEEVAALRAKTQSLENDLIYRPLRAPQARVVQRYIQNPLLLDGRKFDVRSYLLIACTTPYMVFFGHGYARLTLSLYDPQSRDLSGHLTNQFMQKKNPLYVLLKDHTVWSMDQLNHYINDKFRKTKGLPRDWVFTTFTRRMQQIMTHCFRAVKSKFECKLGYFDLIGCDFLIDENFKVWLLEMNANPALHTNCQVLKDVVPGVVAETLDLALETFQKRRRGQKMRPLRCPRRFALLHDGEADAWPGLGGAPHVAGPAGPPDSPPPRAPGPQGAESDTGSPERPRDGGGDPAPEQLGGRPGTGHRGS